MGKIGKSFSLLLILILAVSSLTVILATIPFGLAQSGTNVNGIITSNTTWIQANSPYTFTGPVAVNTGVTLTIQAGVTVNIGTNFLQVNGTLVAKGRASELITFKGIMIRCYVETYMSFSQSSTSWDQGTGTGCIIQNCKITDVSININDASPKIDESQIYSEVNPPANGGNINVNGGNPIISGNNITVNNAINVAYGNPTIIYNTIYVSSASSNAIGIGGGGGSSIICDNNVTGNSYALSGISFYGNAPNSIVSDNIISNWGDGIEIFQGNSGTLTIQRNLITGCYAGIETYKAGVIIQNNTFVNAKNGLAPTSLYLHASPVVIYNNFQSNTGSIWLTSSGNVNAAYNWWGTTNTQAINQTVHDSKNDFTVGTVSFVPFLTAPNPEAMPDPNTPIPTPNTSPSPTATPNSTPTATPITQSTPSPTPAVPELSWYIVVPLLISVLSIAVLFKHRKTANLKQ
jgi:hypothetical protein